MGTADFHFGVRVERHLISRLDVIAAQKDRSRNWLIRRAIAAYIETQNNQSNIPGGTHDLVLKNL